MTYWHFLLKLCNYNLWWGWIVSFKWMKYLVQDNSMTRKFIWCLMHLWVGSYQGPVSAAGRGSVSPGMALSVGVALHSYSLGLFAVLLHQGSFHVTALCSPALSAPRVWSPALFSLGLSLALKAPQHGTSQHSMWGIWAGRAPQGRETATSNSCPSFYLHTKAGKTVFSFAFK